MRRMKELCAEAMKAGAYGLSSGLIYPPGIFAKTRELIEVAKVAAEYGGIYDTHIRGEGRALLKSVKEAITIGEKGRQVRPDKPPQGRKQSGLGKEQNHAKVN